MVCVNTTGRMGVGVISAGKVGCALASALRAAGHTVVGAYAASEESQDRLATMLPGVPALGVEEIVERSELVILALPDAEIEPLVSGLAKLGAWQPGQIVFHTAGPLGTEVLSPAVAQGVLGLAIHPAMSFSGTSLDVARLNGARFAVSAPAQIQPIGLALAAEMGGEGVVVANADRPVYYAALVHGANHLVTVTTQAERLLAEIGIDDAGGFLRPLVQGALDSALSSGESQLGGPLDRGTEDRLAQSIAEIATDVPALADVAKSFAVITDATEARLRSRNLEREDFDNEENS